jgi:hypothetical protein
MEHRLPARVGPTKIDPGTADYLHGSHWQNYAHESFNTASYDRIARPTSTDGVQAGGRLAGGTQPGVKIGSDSATSSVFEYGKVFLALSSELVFRISTGITQTEGM